MGEITILQWVFGGGIAAGLAAAGIRLIQSLALKDQAQRADLSGNLSVIGNYGSFVERLTTANEALIAQLKEQQEETERWRSKYYLLLVEKNHVEQDQ
ncbi:hypothetical protein AVV28_gp32 [Achromobacter phage JWX]|uniref:Uncharacterized protein n=1 Tax=Achromobacter phage JWX TaxID=1589746 RepID=A0A0B5A1N9_9CAUD|nr:hypothetical protein AVV28_gp32 [Achromobacter phage JWX]AJD82798.1 hypothetical protein JWX_00032 [Achromobacter phage JWX]WLW38451.1 hypothetical protein JWT_00027 [Achromobacter phage JWT]